MAQSKLSGSNPESKNEQTGENQERYCFESAASNLQSRAEILNFLGYAKGGVKDSGNNEAITGFLETLGLVSAELNGLAADLEQEVSRVYREFKTAEG